jgi:hypothetical protein
MIDVQLLKSEVQMNEKCDKQKLKVGSGFFIRHATTPPCMDWQKNQSGRVDGEGR